MNSELKRLETQLPSVVELIAKRDAYISGLESRLNISKTALDNIKKHFDLMGSSITDNSITYKIATDALKRLKGMGIE